MRVERVADDGGGGVADRRRPEGPEELGAVLGPGLEQAGFLGHVVAVGAAPLRPVGGGGEPGQGQADRANSGSVGFFMRTPRRKETAGIQAGGDGCDFRQYTAASGGVAVYAPRAQRRPAAFGACNRRRLCHPGTRVRLCTCWTRTPAPLIHETRHESRFRRPLPPRFPRRRRRPLPFRPPCRGGPAALRAAAAARQGPEKTGRRHDGLLLPVARLPRLRPLPQRLPARRQDALPRLRRRRHVRRAAKDPTISARSTPASTASRSTPTSPAALTLGGDKLAVDGVLLIGEHGDYPMNEKMQKLYPRYEYFQKIVEVFTQVGPKRAGLLRQAPVLRPQEGAGDGGDGPQGRLPADGRVEPADHLAAAGAGISARRAAWTAPWSRRAARWRFSAFTPWNRCSAWWSGGRRRNRASRRCVPGGRRGVEGGRRRPVVVGPAGGGAGPQPVAERRRHSGQLPAVFAAAEPADLPQGAAGVPGGVPRRLQGGGAAAQRPRGRHHVRRAGWRTQRSRFRRCSTCRRRRAPASCKRWR